MSSASPKDRLHDNKVYVAAVWGAARHEGGSPQMSLAEFKARLVAANRVGLLRLGRADRTQWEPTAVEIVPVRPACRITLIWFPKRDDQ